MDAVLTKLEDLANMNLSQQKLEELLAKNIMERNALIVALSELGYAVLLHTTSVNGYGRNGYVLDIGYTLMNNPVYLYSPADIPETAGTAGKQ
jgi:hypothetical protein